MNETNTLDEQMEHALRDMTTTETPLLDILSGILSLPIFLMGRIPFLYYVWYGFVYALMETGDYRSWLLLVGTPIAGMVGSSIINGFVDKINKCAVSKELLEQLRDKEFIIHSYDKTGNIPYYMITHSHLIQDSSGFCCGDYINLTYRDYAVACCNMAFTQPKTLALDWNTHLDKENKTEFYLDQFKEDDIRAAEDFSIDGGTDVIFFGSVFLFTPGPKIEGSVSLEVVEPIEYLCKLRNMEDTETLEGPEWEQEKARLFYSNHYVHGENNENESAIGRVFTQRVKDMILRLELHMRAPVELYADKNMVCLVIQEKAISNDKISVKGLGHDVKEAEGALLERMETIREILDIVIGPRGDEYKELFCKYTGQRKSVYSPLLNRFSPKTIPNDNEIKAYVDALIEWPEEQDRFFMSHSRNFHEVCAQMNPLCRHFLTGFFSSEDQIQLSAWINSEAGIKLTNSLTTVMADRFRQVWSAPGKHSVGNITREKNDQNEDIIGIEIDVIFPVRRWYYTEKTNKLMIRLCKSFRNDLSNLYEDKGQRELINEFRKQLYSINELSYGEMHKYKITMSKLQNGYFGFSTEEFNDFDRWYFDFLQSNMKVNGEEFSL